MLRVGLIGLGVHGQRYARHVANDIAGMRLSAVCRRDAAEAEKIAGDHGAAWFTDATRLVESPHVDAVLIVTPPPSHLQLARLALERGKPVLLEKPLTHTLGEARQLEQLVHSSGTALFLAQTLRYNPALQLARRELQRIGHVRALTASQRLPHADLAWQTRDASHPLGSVLNTGVHLYDLVRWLLGAEFESVYCTAYRVENRFHEDLFKVQATLRQRATPVALEIAKCTRSRSSNLELVGERGQLWVDYQFDRVVHVEDTQRHELRAAAPEHTLPHVLRDFQSHVESGTAMPITVRDGVRTLEVVDACYRSVRSGRAERVEIAT